MFLKIIFSTLGLHLKCSLDGKRFYTLCFAHILL